MTVIVAFGDSNTWGYDPENRGPFRPRGALDRGHAA